MGASLPAGPLTAEAEVRGAAGDTLVWIDATGPIGEEPVITADWRGSFEGTPDGFLRAEIVAAAAATACSTDFLRAMGDRPLPGGLTEAEIAAQPFRRAISNPIYLDTKG